jgi:putative hemolysin
MAEIAVVSARRARLEALAENGSKRARIALELASNPNEFVASVQIGTALIGTLAGAFRGATLAASLAAYLNAVPWTAPHAPIR